MREIVRVVRVPSYRRETILERNSRSRLVYDTIGHRRAAEGYRVAFSYR